MVEGDRQLASQYAKCQKRHDALVELYNQVREQMVTFANSFKGEIPK